MGLLRKRPLALFCTCFLVALFVASYLSLQGKIFLCFLFGLVAVTFFVLAVFQRKTRVMWISLLLCALSVSFAFMHMYWRIDRREAMALDYTGKRTVECQILAEYDAREGRSEYVVELLQIGEDRVKIRTYLICGFSANLHAGDRLAARVELKPTDEESYGIRADERVRDENIVLSAVCYDAEDGALLHCAEGQSAWALLWEPNGIRLVGDRMRASVGMFFTQVLGKEIAPLARSFFSGDKSALDARTIRDFRRTGTSHLLAVSGLHVAVLLGGLEWMLRKLTLHKRVRIAVSGVAAVLLLMLTGFSMSACRSVLMLFAVYVYYLLAKENDSVTSLLVAVCTILIVSAEAFWDLGLWMSFLATLGLLTVYPLLDARIPRKRFSAIVPRLLWRIGRAAMMIVLMSVVSGLFLLPIQWLVFREVSLVMLPANLVLSPLGILFLYAFPIGLFLSAIPGIGTVAHAFLTALVRVMTAVLRFFSERNFATVSLEYRFADVIVPCLAAVMLILLFVSLRHKLLIFIPPVIAAIAFGICLCVNLLTQAPVASYYKNGAQRMLGVVDHGEAVICDLSVTGESAYYDMAKTLRGQGATDVDALILTHLSEDHPGMLEEFFAYAVVHRVYLSEEIARQDLSLAKEIVAVSENAGCEVVLYSSNLPFSLFDDTVALAMTDQDASHMACLLMDFDGRILTYVEPTAMTEQMWEACLPQIAESHTVVVFSSSREDTASRTFTLHDTKVTGILLDTPTKDGKIVIDVGDVPIYRCPEDRKKRTISFSLDH